ncbi:hypothetical protein SADUNF_Sadunf17G0079000 [Salix dunnii]|uniref:Uncharacterized protein n=1 Tax=Salix dunnii TaxID=1413687 RepID=A0A835MEP5_9ROSI|nr:hypothetical protein SADUNF_Sadunf17G0079000 [Salix dunnii]
MFSSFSMDGSEDVGEAFSMVTKMFLRIAPFLSTVRTWIFLSSSPGFFLSVFAIFVGFYDKSLFPGFLERESRILVVEKGTERGLLSVANKFSPYTVTAQRRRTSSLHEALELEAASGRKGD